jgi:hypothetical protein
MKKLNHDRITTTIEREWLAQIIIRDPQQGVAKR